MKRKQESAISVLGNLLKICRESEVGLLRAAARSLKPGLKEFLGSEALQQTLCVAELELELRKLGVYLQPLTSHSAMLPGWKELAGTRLLPAGDDTVLLLCEEGERAAMGPYLAAMQSDLPIGVLELVKRQYSRLREAYKRLGLIREQLRNDAQGADRESANPARPSPVKGDYL